MVHVQSSEHPFALSVSFMIYELSITDFFNLLTKKVLCFFLLPLPVKCQLLSPVRPFATPWTVDLPDFSVHGILQARILEWVYVCALVTQSCPTLCNPTNRSPQSSSFHGIPQARILECVVILFPRGYPPRGQNSDLPHCRQILYHLSHEGNFGHIKVRFLLSFLDLFDALP